METARETRARPEDTRPAHAKPQHNPGQRHPGRGFAWAVLLIAGADGLVLNVWHAVHTTLPTPLAVMVGSVPILLATGLTEVVSRTRAGRILWALTFTVMVGTMGLSVAGQASVLAGAFPPAIAIAYPLIMDLATLVALSTITAHDSAHPANAPEQEPGNNPYETPPRDVSGTVSRPGQHPEAQRGKQTGTPTGQRAGQQDGQRDGAHDDRPLRGTNPPTASPQGRPNQGGAPGEFRKQTPRPATRSSARPSAPSWTVETLASKISEDYADADVPTVRELHARYGGRTATVAEAAKRVKRDRAARDDAGATTGTTDGAAVELPVSHHAERPVSLPPAHGRKPAGRQDGKHDAGPGGKRPPLTPVTTGGDAPGNTGRSRGGSTEPSTGRDTDPDAGPSVGDAPPALRLVTPDAP